MRVVDWFIGLTTPYSLFIFNKILPVHRPLRSMAYKMPIFVNSGHAVLCYPEKVFFG
jgi:hypothetical protein